MPTVLITEPIAESAVEVLKQKGFLDLYLLPAIVVTFNVAVNLMG